MLGTVGEPSMGWNMKVGLLVVLVVLSGCALEAVALPPRPALPEVRYVDPCDPKAVAGLTSEAFEALRNRDLLWQRHVERLERQLQGAR
ncbi:MAG: hypothetical protein HYZ72_12770 [Deltaproteobacteria bacterium]|nr:hypothetical protein [Deltaproteobacteria bacterium]